MPWEIRRDNGKFCVVKIPNSETLKCYERRSEAVDYLRALYASEADQAAVNFNLADVEEAIYHLHLALDSDDFDEVIGHVNEALEALGDDDYPDDDHPRRGRYHPEDPHDYPELPGDAYSNTTVEAVNEDKPQDKPVVKEYAWEGPIVFEGVVTGDNRYFRPGSIQWDEETLPWAFRWQKASTKGHEGAVPIGRLDDIERRPGGIIYGYGVIIPSLNEEAAEYFRLIEAGVASGVSVDGDSAQFDIIESNGQPRIEFSSMRLRSLTAVDIPAFNEARVDLVPEDGKLGLTAALKNEERLVEPFILTAAAIPIKPYVEWFEDPKFDGPTPITVTKEGAVSGHLALFNTCHIGFPGSCVTPPRGSSYKYFHTGEVETQEGDTVEVGHLTFNTGHAEMSDNAKAAASHYDHTGTVAADVRAGEDKFGIWVSGALRSTLSDEDIRAFRAAPLSGDWRRIAGKLELVGALAVNVPGFPVPRVRALVASGETNTLFTFTEGDESETVSDYEKALRFDQKAKLQDRIEKFFSNNHGKDELALGLVDLSNDGDSNE